MAPLNIDAMGKAMNQRSSAFAIMLLSCASIVGALVPGHVSAERPNFIIFVADDMAWDDSGAYGNAGVRTPNIDSLADNGIRFDRAYLTCSSCSPSRCSMLTGLYPHSTGAGELHLPLPEDKTLVTAPLRKAGYWTAAVGKWHLGNAVTDQVDYVKPSPPEKMGQAWLKALRARPKDKPFFMWAAHSDPHRGYKPGAVSPPHRREDVSVPPFFPDTDAVRDDLALYYDEVSRFDEHIGLALEELEAQGVGNNTFVLVISDNGRPFPHCKTRVTVPGVRTPFVVHWPNGIKQPRVTERVVSTVDIAPTILELAGAKGISTHQGKSFVSLLSSDDDVVREFAFAEHNWHDYRAFERGVHTKRFCYVRNWLPNIAGTPPADAVRSPTYDEMKRLKDAGVLATEQKGCFSTPRPEEFLYDVVADPHCLNNLASSSTHTKTLAKLRSALASWMEQTEDEFPGEDALTPDGFDRDSGQRLIQGAHPSLQKN